MSKTKRVHLSKGDYAVKIRKWDEEKLHIQSIDIFKDDFDLNFLWKLSIHKFNDENGKIGGSSGICNTRKTIKILAVNQCKFYTGI